MVHRFTWIILALLLTATSTVADGESGTEVNRRLVGTAREDPEHYHHLLRNLNDFLQLDPDTSGRLRQLDQDLHRLPPGEAAKLRQALTRYSTWLNSLPERERRRIEEAATPTEKLTIV